MNFKLAIKDVVNVPIKTVFNDEGTTRRFEFKLICTRMKSDPLQDAIKQEDNKTADFMKGVVIDWSGQRLVLDDSGEPAPFSQEALDVMLSAPGVANLAFTAYLVEVGARAKN